MSNSITLKFTHAELVLLVSVLEIDVLRDQEETGHDMIDLSCVHETKYAYERACMLEDLKDRLKEFSK